MEIQYLGANCIRLSSKKATIIIDDNLAELGLKTATKPDDIALFTAEHKESPAKLVIDLPGEYEVSNTSIQGIAAQSHLGESDKQQATMFKIISDDIRILVIGHIFPKLDETQLEKIGTIDVVIVPIGGMGYTMDGIGALTLIKEIEPKIIIPTHFADKAVRYPVPQLDLTEGIKGLAMEPKEALPKLKLKPTDLPLETQLIVLERS